MNVPHDRPQLIELPNGNTATRTFSDAEYERRLIGLRRIMVEQNLDAVLFTSMHSIAYYSDFLYCSFGRPYGLVVTHHGQSTLSANIDFGQPWRKTFGDNLVFTDWERDNYWRGVSKLAGATPRLGIEFDHLTLQGPRSWSTSSTGQPSSTSPVHAWCSG